MSETCPSTRWADAGGGSCTDTPRGEPIGAAWDLTESVGLMREASRRAVSQETARWSAPLGGYPRGAASLFAHNVEAMAARRRVEHPWI